MRLPKANLKYAIYIILLLDSSYIHFLILFQFSLYFLFFFISLYLLQFHLINIYIYSKKHIIQLDDFPNLFFCVLSINISSMQITILQNLLLSAAKFAIMTYIIFTSVTHISFLSSSIYLSIVSIYPHLYYIFIYSNQKLQYLVRRSRCMQAYVFHLDIFLPAQFSRRILFSRLG